MSLTPAERKLVEDFKRDLPEILEGRDPFIWPEEDSSEMKGALHVYLLEDEEAWVREQAARLRIPITKFLRSIVRERREACP